MSDNPYVSPAGQPELKLWPTLGKAVEVITAPMALVAVVMIWPIMFVVCFCLEWRDIGLSDTCRAATEFICHTWWMFAFSVLAWASAFYFGGAIR